MSVLDEVVIRIRAMGGKAAAADIGEADAAIGGLKKSSVGSTVAVVAMGFALDHAVKAATAWQANVSQLNNVLKNQHLYTAQASTSLQDYADAASTKGGFDPSTQIVGMTALVTATHSITEAQKDNNLIMDIARARHLSYNTVLKAVIQAEEGHPAVLRRYSIEIDKHTTSVQALQEAWVKYSGATEAYSNTAAGAMSNLKNMFEIFEVEVGTAVLPILSTLLGVLADTVRWLSKNKDVVYLLGIAVGVLTAAYVVKKGVQAANLVLDAIAAVRAGAAAVATTAWAVATGAYSIAAGIATTATIALMLAGLPLWASIAAIVAIVAVLVAGLYLLVTHFGWVKHAAKDVWDWIKGTWPTLKDVLVKPFVDAWNWIRKVFDGILKDARWLIHEVTGVFKTIFEPGQLGRPLRRASVRPGRRWHGHQRRHVHGWRKRS